MTTRAANALATPQSIGFWDAVNDPDGNFLFNLAEDVFCFSGRKLEVIPGAKLGNSQGVHWVGNNPSMIDTCLKIFIWASLVGIPLMFILKIVHRMTHEFFLVTNGNSSGIPGLDGLLSSLRSIGRNAGVSGRSAPTSFGQQVQQDHADQQKMLAMLKLQAMMAGGVGQMPGGFGGLNPSEQEMLAMLQLQVMMGEVGAEPFDPGAMSPAVMQEARELEALSQQLVFMMAQDPTQLNVDSPQDVERLCDVMRVSIQVVDKMMSIGLAQARLPEQFTKLIKQEIYNLMVEELQKLAKIPYTHRQTELEKLLISLDPDAAQEINALLIPIRQQLQEAFRKSDQQIAEANQIKTKIFNTLLNEYKNLRQGRSTVDLNSKAPTVEEVVATETGLHALPSSRGSFASDSDDPDDPDSIIIPIADSPVNSDSDD
jgi:hypothetical protein